MGGRVYGLQNFLVFVAAGSTQLSANLYVLLGRAFVLYPVHLIFIGEFPIGPAFEPVILCLDPIVIVIQDRALHGNQLINWRPPSETRTLQIRISVGGPDGTVSVNYILPCSFSIRHDPVFERARPSFTRLFKNALYRGSNHAMYLDQFAIHHRPENHRIKAAKLSKLRKADIGRVTHHTRPEELVPCKTFVESVGDNVLP